MHRVVITGIGVISPLGQDYTTFRQELFAGTCGIRPISNIPTDRLTIKNAGEVKDFDIARWIDPKAAGLMDRFAQFACAAAKQAIDDSGLDFNANDELAEATACIIGSGVGGQNTQEENYNRLHRAEVTGGTIRLHPLTIPKLMVSAASSHVSMQFNIRGANYVIASACASANHAIGAAFHYVKHGMARAAVTGGTDACVTFGTMKGWEALRVMAPDVCRPFSRGRNGMSLGEGAAIFTLERLEDAQARGAKIYAELCGFGQSADARDLTSPDPAGAGRAVRAALADGKLAPTDIHYINAHGTGTTINDATETGVMKDVFGEHARKLAISSTKSQLGHALGAAGALELAASLAAIGAQTAPPTVNFVPGDPACDLDYVPNESRAMKISALLSNSFAFGGLNAVLALKKF